MKIGIISINAHTKVLNLASPLHSYAFQQFLEQNGFDSLIIDYKPNYYGKFNPKYPYLHYRKHKSKDSKKQKELESRWRRLFFARRTRFNKVQNFIDTYYKTTSKCYTAKILDNEEVEEGIDCYICATDVIWKYADKTGFDKGFMLGCKTMEGKGKIAYSASRGASVYTEEQEKKFLKYIKKFDYVSVREKSLYDYIRSVSDIPVAHVIDPVMLHERDFYEKIMKRPKKKGYVLVYNVMANPTDIVKLAVDFAKKRGLDVIELSEYYENKRIVKGVRYKVIYDIGIEEWLGYMHDAEYIFTNSFHASCFSILFEKQFFTGKRAGGKITSLLELLGLSDRAIAECFDKKKNYIGEDIDYAPVNEKRREIKEASAKFLLDAIRDVEKKQSR